jgi:nucleoside-triphosphatase THEP1
MLLTGRRGVGKTTVCQAVADLAHRRGYRPGGVITPALYDPYGTKVGFKAVDVGSGEGWPLAHTDPSTGSGHRRELGGPRVGPYSFDPAALGRALRVLRRAISAGCDLLMVDEIGPLELEQGQGFAPILDLLPVEGLTHTLIVVRPALLDPLLLHLRDIECTIFGVTEENRNKLPLRIVEELWGIR